MMRGKGAGVEVWDEVLGVRYIPIMAIEKPIVLEPRKAMPLTMSTVRSCRGVWAVRGQRIKEGRG